MLYGFFVFAASRELGVYVFGFCGLEGSRGIDFFVVHGLEGNRGICFLF